MAQHNKKKDPGSLTPSFKGKWPVPFDRPEVKWYPASTRLIGLIRQNNKKSILPPAVVRKASWRD